LTGAGSAIDRARPAAALPEARRKLGFGPIVIELRSDDAAAAEWLAEFLGPWFGPAAGDADWHATLSTARAAFRALVERRPRDAALRPCFALDQQVISLPAWPERGGVAVADLERSCCLVVEPGRVALHGDPDTRRWRFTLQWVFHELSATRLRRTALDLHAAAVATGGRAIAIVGPKGAGKTTLSFHLLRSGRCRWIANDRAFAEPSARGIELRGMPTPVKILAPTLERFPELGRGLRPFDRPYLDALAEVLAEDSTSVIAPPRELALSPAQVAHQLHVDRLAAAPLAAIVFPEIRSDVDAFAIEPLDPKQVASRLWANLYGKPSGRSEPTVFEDLAGGLHPPRRRLADEAARSAPGYRVVLGRNARSELATRLLDLVER